MSRAAPRPGDERAGEQVDLDVVIVNWNTGGQLSDCLSSFPAALSDVFELSRIIVVDNASTDGSADCAAAIEGLPMELSRNRVNCGFAAACNKGAAAGSARYILFLNPDTRLFSDSLRAPLTFMESPANQDVGIVGIQLVEDDGRVARSCARAPTPTLFWAKTIGLDVIAPRWAPSLTLNEWDHSLSRDVDHVIGAFYLVRRSIWQAMHGFDERFFVYLEDVDFSNRVRTAGYRVYFLASAQAFHKGGGSSSTVKAMRVCLALHSRIRYGYKHFGWWSATALLAGVLFLEPWARLAGAVVRRDAKQARDTIKCYALLWRRLVRGDAREAC